MAILSKQETAVMQAVYELARNRQAALFGLEDIMARIKPVRRLHKKEKAILSEPSEITAEALPKEEMPQELVEAEEVVSAVPERKKKATKPPKRVKEETVEKDEVPAKVYVDEPPVVKGWFEYLKPVRYDEMPHILEVLDMEEYIELTEAKADGEIQYVAELLSRGRRWERDEADRKRAALIKLGMTAITPILSFIFGILLRTLF